MLQAERTSQGSGRRREAEEPSKKGAQEPLEERLRHLDWPKPPPGVRERILEEIMRRPDSQ